MNELLISLALILVKLGLIFGVVLTMAAYLVLAERKILGRMQLRYGPNRIGPGDWAGWVKERGLYFAKAWDDAYVPLLEMADPGEAPPS